MDVYVSSSGSQKGPFSLQQIREMQDRREILPDDYAWYPGLPGWVLIAQLKPDGSIGPPPLHQKATVRHGAAEAFGRVAGGISSVAGVERVEGLKGREFFSDIFKKRTDDDIEELFITGTKGTTPPLNTVDTHWPKPWAFFKGAIAAVILFAGFFYGVAHFQNPNCIPGLILVGSFGVPLATLIFFVEMNVPRNVSLYQVFKLVNAGGLVAIIMTLFFGTLFTTQTTWGFAISTGIIEESAKLLTVLLFMRNRRFTWSLNGFLLGAAVGAGFAAFESAGYALRFLLVDFVNSTRGQDTNFMLQAIIERALLAPAGHVVWTGLATAGLWKVKGDRPFNWGMITDARFYRVFALVVACHAIWDSPLPYFGGELAQILKGLLLGFVAWVAALAYIQDGLKQIRQAQVAESAPTTTIPQASPA